MENKENSKIICVLFNVKNQLTLERVRRISQSLSKLTKISCIDLNYNRISDELFQQLLNFAINSKFCKSIDKNRLLFCQKTVCTDSCVHWLSIDKTSKDMKIIFEFMWNLYELLKNIRNDIKNDLLLNYNNCENYSIILVIPESLCHKIQESFQLMCFLYNLKQFKLKLITVSNVNIEQEFDSYINCLFEKLFQQNRDSLDRNSGFIF